MRWIEITLETTTPGAEIAAVLLEEAGCNGTAIEDPQDIICHINRQGWDVPNEELLSHLNDRVRVKGYIPKDEYSAARIKTLHGRMEDMKTEALDMDIGEWTVRLQELDEEDWANSWKQYYKPLHIGKHMVIKPLWEDYTPLEQEKIIHMNPGMAFGTGTHETTRLCLTLLESRITPETMMLDVGTGSGILAVSSLVLGAQSAIAVDIDPLAVKIAKENALLNGVECRLTAHCGDLAEGIDGQYSLICANIVADIVLRLTPDIARLLAPDGVFIAGGIIDERFDEVNRKVCAQGFTAVEFLKENSWCAIAYMREK